MFYCLSFFILAIFIYKELLTYPTNIIVSFDRKCIILVSCCRIQQRSSSWNIATAVSNIAISLYHSFAIIISNIVCGVFFQYIGGRLMLKMMAAANGIWGLVFVLFYLRYSNYLKKTDHQRRNILQLRDSKEYSLRRLCLLIHFIPLIFFYTP